MEQFSFDEFDKKIPEQSSSDIDPAWIQMYEAVEIMSRKHKFRSQESKEKFLNQELRKRAIGHSLDLIEFGSQYRTWKGRKDEIH